MFFIATDGQVLSYFRQFAYSFLQYIQFYYLYYHTVLNFGNDLPLLEKGGQLIHISRTKPFCVTSMVDLCTI